MTTAFSRWPGHHRSLAVLVAAVLLLSGCSLFGGQQDDRRQARSSSSPEAVAFTESDAEKLSRELVSGDADRVERVVALPTEVSRAEVAQSLATLGAIDIDPDTFAITNQDQDQDQDQATVEGRTDRADWLLHLVLGGSTWKLAATEPLS